MKNLTKAVRDNVSKEAALLKAPTPKWAKVLRTIGIGLTIACGAVTAQPELFGAGLVLAAKYGIAINAGISYALQRKVKK